MIKILQFLVSILAVSAIAVLENSIFLTNNEDYLISNSTNLTFIQAYATCKRYGYTLAIERSAEDTVALNNAIATAGLKTNNFWIGGFRQNDDNFAAEWIWLETGEALDYTNWSVNETITRTCLMRRDLHSHEGTWFSMDCTENVHFICQKDAS